MIRTFIALELDEAIRLRLNELGRAIPAARPIPAEQIHLTLRFIGDVDGACLRDITEALTEIQAAPLCLTIKGVGHFPPRGMPRVVWAGVEPAGAITGLRNQINGLLQRLGIPREERSYHPHITIARLKSCPIGRIADFLSGNSLLQSPPLTLDSFALFTSTLTENGALHRKLAAYRLSEPPER